jgi:hypothetical protein
VCGVPCTGRLYCNVAAATQTVVFSGLVALAALHGCKRLDARVSRQSTTVTLRDSLMRDCGG